MPLSRPYFELVSTDASPRVGDSLVFDLSREQTVARFCDEGTTSCDDLTWAVVEFVEERTNAFEVRYELTLPDRVESGEAVLDWCTSVPPTCH